MIGPNMATMLGFVLTDAAVAPADLHRILKTAAEQSFNCISVEGHTSTNDTVFLLANGTGPPLAGQELEAFAVEVRHVCVELARKIAIDAEGREHLITIEVEGCRTDAEAKQIAKTVAESALVKTAVFGADPNWGRVVSAAGYAGVVVRGERPLAVDGRPAAVPGRHAAAVRRERRVRVPEAQPRGPLQTAVHARLRPLHVLHLRPDLRVREAERGLHDLIGERPA